MVRKRKSLPRDSKGFEPIEQYFKEFDEEMNQDSNGKTIQCYNIETYTVYIHCMCIYYYNTHCVYITLCTTLCVYVR